MTSTTASAIRPSLRDNRQLSGSPHTPSRFISSNYSSPGSTFRQEEDAVVIELDTRSLKAGFEGESGPQCVLSFGPDGARRVGDYRIWLPDYKRKTSDVVGEAESYELWRNDLKEFDTGLLEDKLERTVREAYNKYLLTDAGTARLVLVLPSLIPFAIISSILTTLFERWKYATITMLPAPTMCTLAAGLRSALVVDIGWEETSVTPVYEYRELAIHRSTRGMKMLVEKMAEKLHSIALHHVSEGEGLRQDFNFIEDFVGRMAFCTNTGGDIDSELMDKLSLEPTKDHSPSKISFDWPTQSAGHTISFDKTEISSAVDDAFFGGERETCYDDQEQPISQLVYQALLRLPPDIRGVCMSRIIFSGRGEAIPGLKQSVIDQVASLEGTYGWNAVRGRHVKPIRKGLTEIAQGRAVPVDFKHNMSLPPDRDFVEEKLLKQKAKESQAGPQGSLRSVDSLGPWAGASLLTSLKIKGVVEVERERFLSHGLAGASRDQDGSVMLQRMNTFGVGTTKSGERTSWTLAGWG